MSGWKVSLLKRTAQPAKVGHMKAFMKDFVFDIVKKLLCRENNMPFPCNFDS